MDKAINLMCVSIKSGYFMDITGTKQAEQALRAVLQLSNLLFLLIRKIPMILDYDGGWYYATGGNQRFFACRVQKYNLYGSLGPRHAKFPYKSPVVVYQRNKNISEEEDQVAEACKYSKDEY